MTQNEIVEEVIPVVPAVVQEKPDSLTMKLAKKMLGVDKTDQ